MNTMHNMYRYSINKNRALLSITASLKLIKHLPYLIHLFAQGYGPYVCKKKYF